MLSLFQNYEVFSCIFPLTSWIFNSELLLAWVRCRDLAVYFFFPNSSCHPSAIYLDIAGPALSPLIWPAFLLHFTRFQIHSFSHRAFLLHFTRFQKKQGLGPTLDFLFVCFIDLCLSCARNFLSYLHNELCLVHNGGSCSSFFFKNPIFALPFLYSSRCVVLSPVSTWQLPGEIFKNMMPEPHCRPVRFSGGWHEHWYGLQFFRELSGLRSTVSDQL